MKTLLLASVALLSFTTLSRANDSQYLYDFYVFEVTEGICHFEGETTPEYHQETKMVSDELASGFDNADEAFLDALSYIQTEVPALQQMSNAEFADFCNGVENVGETEFGLFTYEWNEQEDTGL